MAPEGSVTELTLILQVSAEQFVIVGTLLNLMENIEIIYKVQIFSE